MPLLAWVVDFDDGSVATAFMNLALPARAVRGP
jgi:hypothetical protein